MDGKKTCKEYTDGGVPQKENAAETAEWDFRRDYSPYNGVRVPIHRERGDAFGGFSGVIPPKRVVTLVTCPLCGGKTKTLETYEGQKLCPSCLEGIAEGEVYDD